MVLKCFSRYRNRLRKQIYEERRKYGMQEERKKEIKTQYESKTRY
jgi:hypothetical protein